jgi:hypothetical protein
MDFVSTFTSDCSDNPAAQFTLECYTPANALCFIDLVSTEAQEHANHESPDEAEAGQVRTAQLGLPRCNCCSYLVVHRDDRTPSDRDRVGPCRNLRFILCRGALLRTPNKRLVNGEIDFCGNNGNGILGACYLKRHKWLNLKALVNRQTYVRSLKHCFSSFSGAAGSFSALAGMGSFTVALLTYIFVTIKK